MYKDRVILYVIYERDGILDEWYENLFNEFKRHSSNLICVVNGTLNVHSSDILDKYFNKVLHRENKGYDVSAYKEGILYLYNAKLLDKELIMCNNSFFAPIYPFDDMLNTMMDKEYDFWGITSIDEHDNIPFHIQSYFYLFKENVVTSKEFISFFQNMKEIKNYQDAVESVELKLTNYLINYGYKAGSYMDEKINGSYSHDVLSLIKNGCPVLKRRKLVFSKKYGFNHGLSNINLFNYIEHNTSFNIGQIYKNLSREFSFDRMDYCLNNNVIIDEAYKYNENRQFSIKYLISYNDKSHKIIEQLQNKYEFIDNIEYIKTDSFKDILNNIKESNNFDFYTHIGLIYRDFLPEEINFILFEHIFLSLLGNNSYNKNLCHYISEHNYIGMAIPFDFFHGIKFNNIIKLADTAYDICRNNNIIIPKAESINILSLSSSFIIKNQIRKLLEITDFENIACGYKSYITGGMLLRYLTQSEGLLAVKITESQQAGQLVNNYAYKYHNQKLEDIIKSWWLTKKIML